jgi:uncharacterized protein YfaP (DUF2135 family)
MYTVAVAPAVANVTVSATKSDPNATMSGSVVAPPGQASGQATIQLNGPGTDTPVSITVTAPNGTSKTYTVTVRRAETPPSLLQSLTLSPGTLVPAFNANTTNYGLNVASTVGSVTVTALPQGTASVVINGQTTTSRTVNLNAAGMTTTITIIVTASGGNPNTYTVVVDRPTCVSNLSSLSVSAGALSPTFNSNTTNYNVTTSPDTGTTTVTATAQTAGSTLTINGQSVTSGQVFGPVLLPGGPINIPIIVTAPGCTPRTYTVTINRPIANPFTITLTWGANPADLDAHLVVPTSGTPTDVYFANKGTLTSSPFANLDIDDQNGFGPEVVTMLPNFTGTYRYVVHLFTGTGSLPTSGARVVVARGGTQLLNLPVPSAGTGRCWQVFTINGASGAVTSVNTLFSSAGSVPGLNATCSGTPIVGEAVEATSPKVAE